MYIQTLNYICTTADIVRNNFSDQSCKLYDDVQIEAGELLQALDVTLQDQNL